MKVLVVDDDPSFRLLMSEMLKAADYEVVTEGNGRLAWNRLQTETADLAVLDVKMPEMDGFELLRHIRADDRFKSMPVLMLTIRALCDDQVLGYETGADDYLAKPFDRGILMSRLKVLERRIIRRSA